MSKPTPADIEAAFARLARHEMTARQVIALLIEAGEDPIVAEEYVWTALGGSDIVIGDADGRERYYGSGRLVSEIEAEMEK